MAVLLGRSYDWAPKWAKRLRAAPPEDVQVLISQSRARTTAPPTWDALVLRRIEQIRLFPPEGLRHTPGPKAIAYYLPRDPTLQTQGCRLPRSTSTIWKLLTELGLIATDPSHQASRRAAVRAAGRSAGRFQRCEFGAP